jgi:hypothetical protein
MSCYLKHGRRYFGPYKNEQDAEDCKPWNLGSSAMDKDPNFVIVDKTDGYVHPLGMEDQDKGDLDAMEKHFPDGYEICAVDFDPSFFQAWLEDHDTEWVGQPGGWLVGVVQNWEDRRTIKIILDARSNEDTCPVLYCERGKVMELRTLADAALEELYRKAKATVLGMIYYSKEHGPKDVKSYGTKDGRQFTLYFDPSREFCEARLAEMQLEPHEPSELQAVPEVYTLELDGTVMLAWAEAGIMDGDVKEALGDEWRTLGLEAVESRLVFGTY